MVVCKCRKATKLYCFVHKVPVCGECICFPEHQLCVVRTYSEWVIDGEYDWPPTCCMCQEVLQTGSDPQTTRLGCLHIIHLSCFMSHIKSFPLHTTPAGYVCPSCSSPIWPPRNIKDSSSRFHTKLKEAFFQTGLEKSLFGNHVVSFPAAESNAPPAFDSDPLVRVSHIEEENHLNEGYTATTGEGSKLSTPEIVEIGDSNSLGNQFSQVPDPSYIKNMSSTGPGATVRKPAYSFDRQNSEMSYYADDEDGNIKKYTRRGPFLHKFLRNLLPFWSSALPTLPVTTPSRKDGIVADDVHEGRLKHKKSSKMDPGKLLLTIAIIACMATMVILYYRIAQSDIEENLPEDELQ